MNQLLAPQAMAVTAYGLHIPEGLTYEEWQPLLRNARNWKSAYLSALSDLTAYGRRAFGDEMVNAAIEQLEFDLSDATKAEFIALVDLGQRTLHDLSSEHAYILGKCCSTAEEREKWAAICKEHALSAFELKKSIENNAVTRGDDISEKSGHGKGIPTMQAVQFQFLNWQRQFGERSKILSLPKKEREKILQLLNPIIDLADQIATSLQSKK